MRNFSADLVAGADELPEYRTMRRLFEHDGEIRVVDEIRVVVADEDDTRRTGLRDVLEREGFVVCAEETGADEAVTATFREKPTLCLLAANLPGGALIATGEIADECPATRVVLIAADPDEDDCMTSLLAGASAYLDWNAPPRRLTTALREVAAGIPSIPHRFHFRLLEELRRDAD